jgi:biopolymer transport protein ExbB
MARLLTDAWEGLRSFIEAGGPALLAIFVVILLMWAIIAERAIFGAYNFPRVSKNILDQWQARSDRSSWAAEQIRNELLSRASEQIERGLNLLKTLIAICPLLGLLGTIMGMIEVFNIMALVGSGNSRAMASGIFMAILPTMAGMVGAISGIFFSARLGRKAKEKLLLLEDRMPLERGQVCAAN